MNHRGEQTECTMAGSLHGIIPTVGSMKKDKLVGKVGTTVESNKARSITDQGYMTTNRLQESARHVWAWIKVD